MRITGSYSRPSRHCERRCRYTTGVYSRWPLCLLAGIVGSAACSLAQTSRHCKRHCRSLCSCELLVAYSLLGQHYWKLCSFSGKASIINSRLSEATRGAGGTPLHCERLLRGLACVNSSWPFLRPFLRMIQNYWKCCQLSGTGASAVGECCLLDSTPTLLTKISGVKISSSKSSSVSW